MMKQRKHFIGSMVAASASLIFTTSTIATAATATSASSSQLASSSKDIHVCGLPSIGSASCNAIQLLHPNTNWKGQHFFGVRGQKKPVSGGTTPTAPLGYYPYDLRAAYNLTSAASTGGLTATGRSTVAIVDAYNDPYAYSDLNTYRNYMSSNNASNAHGSYMPPLCSASVTSGCVHLTVENQTGAVLSTDGATTATKAPRSNASWSQEISLDLDMVSAVCANCNIELIEASDTSFSSLAAAAQTAVNSGAVAVSNSYGGSEVQTEASYDSSYQHMGVVVTASAGDNGYGAEYPAASPDVVAVGGTTLSPSGTGWSETAWSSAASGCSAYEARPSWQFVAGSWCTNGRQISDIAAVADPSTGVAVYDSYNESGWLVFGGTSVASPIVASVYALAGVSPTLPAGSGAQALWQNSGSSDYRLVQSGSNSGTCSQGDYLCNAKFSIGSTYNPVNRTAWYNGPTGNGTPLGTTGF